MLSVGNQVSAGVVRHLKIEKLIGHASIPYSLAQPLSQLRVRSPLVGKFLCFPEPKQLSVFRGQSAFAGGTSRYGSFHRYRIEMTPKRKHSLSLMSVQLVNSRTGCGA